MKELERMISELIAKEHININDINVDDIVAEVKKAYTQAHSTIA